MNQSEPINRRDFWRAHIEEHQKSGKSRKDYCIEHGLKKEQFGYYSAALNKKPHNTPKDFVKIGSPRPARGFSLKLSGGVSIECPANKKLLNEVLKLIIESH